MSHGVRQRVTMSYMKKDKSITVRIPSEVHDRLTEWAETTDRSVSWVVNLALEEWLHTQATGKIDGEPA